MDHQVPVAWPGGFVGQLPQPPPYTAEQLESIRSMAQPRHNRLPQNVAARPRQAALPDPSSQELRCRPLSIGASEDVATRHFKHLRPGSAFGHSQTGQFGGYGRSFWKHVADVYDWEQSMCTNEFHRPGLREITTGIRLVIGDEFADHILAPHGYLAQNTSSLLSDAERHAYAHSKYIAMVFKAEGIKDQEEFVVLLMMIPEQHVLSFGACAGSSKKEYLHKTAIAALDKMLRDNNLPGVQDDRSAKSLMSVTSGSPWVNPYLTLEAFRVFVRESRRQVCDYEDWKYSDKYMSIAEPERRWTAVRNNWLGDLRAALGHRIDLPLRSMPVNNIATPVNIRRQPRYTGSHYPVIREESTWSDEGQDANEEMTSAHGHYQNNQNAVPNTAAAEDDRASMSYASERDLQGNLQCNTPSLPSSPNTSAAGDVGSVREPSGLGPRRPFQSNVARRMAPHNGSPVDSPSIASDTSGWGLEEYFEPNRTSDGRS